MILNFYEIPPYNANPVAGVVFMELPLEPAEAGAPHPRALNRRLGILLKTVLSVSALMLAAATVTGCGSVQTQRRNLTERAEVATIDHKSPFLKAHMRDGDVYILSRWSVDTMAGTVSGEGERLDPSRTSVGKAAHVILLDSVALFETNVVQRHSSVSALAVITGASLALTAYCLTNTKACFGSCPTFYVFDGERAVLQAEGFSASVAPALEATDIDSTDLAAREVIDLEFPASSGDNLGLVIGSRQTLLSTYVLYQALAYMGRSVGYWLAALQRGDARAREQSRGIGRALGGIEVQALDSGGTWITVGQTQETGPLATDVRVVPLPGLRRGTTRLRLRLARGYWRIDYLALASLSGRVHPLHLDPVLVRRGSTVDARALALLTDSSRTLTTLPGDEYTLIYELPENFDRYELFLEARGYYLEWMRQEWLAEENPGRAAMMILDPERALRVLAPEFKRREAEMETVFWRSRYVRH